MANRTCNCSLCGESVSTQGITFLDPDHHDVLPGNADMELMCFCCSEGHRFYVNKPDFESA